MNSLDDEQQEEKRYEEDDSIDGGIDGAAYPIDSYDLVSSPNDFNTATIVNFIESNIYIPDFQRNYVWSIKLASRLIESAIVGLPIPQVFLYEQERNKMLIVDGQQRLMTIYYFRKGRFPKKKALHELRSKFIDQNKISEMPLANDDYFTDFQLELLEPEGSKPNPLHKLAYKDLPNESKSALDLRTIRNVVVRQLQPEGYGSIYEIFSRLNSGGVKLAPQEIRRCMFRSKFFDMLYTANTKPEWRRFIGAPNPDLHAKDVEVLLRGFAMLVNGGKYTPPLVRFLDNFSYAARKIESSELDRLKQTLYSFLNNNKHLPEDAFYSATKRFSAPIFESVFVAACADSHENNSDVKIISPTQLKALKNDFAFKEAAHNRTASGGNVKIRLDRARAILVGNDA